jgi:hypothetical protein
MAKHPHIDLDYGAFRRGEQALRPSLAFGSNHKATTVLPTELQRSSCAVRPPQGTNARFQDHQLSCHYAITIANSGQVQSPADTRPFWVHFFASIFLPLFRLPPELRPNDQAKRWRQKYRRENPVGY